MTLRAAFWLLLLTVTVGQRLGVNFGSYSLSLALPAMYALLAVAACTGTLGCSLERLLLFGLALAVGLSSTLSNAGHASAASLALTFVTYLPFLFVLRPSAGPSAAWASRAFSNLALLCAFAGIAQFYAQFVVRADWLFDFTPYLPAVLRGPSGFNTVISVGSLHKSNGFFFHEPSGFSLFMALGLVAEWTGERRSFRLACLGFALLLTYSGTGLFALLIGMLFPLGVRTLGRVALLVGAGALSLWLLGDVLNLSFTLGRAAEFGSERSSGYIRYVAPLRLVADCFDSDPWAPWVGHGPGTIFQAAPGYEFHDPTWAKLLFEYGALGFAAFVALFRRTLAGPGVAPPLRATLFFAWLLLGGHLLSPEQNFLTLALVGLWSEGPLRAGNLARPSLLADGFTAPLLPVARTP